MNYYLTQAGVNLLKEGKKNYKQKLAAKRFKTAQDAKNLKDRHAGLSPKESEVQTQLDKDKYNIKVSDPLIHSEVKSALHAHRGKEGCIGAACTAAIHASKESTPDVSKKKAQQAERGLATGQTTPQDHKTIGQSLRQKRADR
jgi:hypothetical protein